MLETNPGLTGQRTLFCGRGMGQEIYEFPSGGIVFKRKQLDKSCRISWRCLGVELLITRSFSTHSMACHSPGG